MQSDEVDVGKFGAATYYALHILHINAELVLGESRLYVGMCVCSHVGIDAQAYGGCAVELGSEVVDDFQFGYALHVEAEDALLQTETYLPVALANAGINNLFCGESGFKCSTYLTAAHAVGPQSCLCNLTQNAGVGIGFDGIVHVHVVIEQTVDDAQRVSQKLGVVVVEGSLYALKLL